MSTTLITNIKSLLQTDDGSRKLVSGKDMAVIPSIDTAWLLIENNHIHSFGTMDTVPERADNYKDATGKFVLPAWCDSHTHLVFADSREEEFVMRIQGKTYEQIAEAGGGILNSARKLQAMDFELLYEKTAQRLEEVMSYGTGAIEIKSGYGLTTESEIKMLKVIRKLKENYAIPIKATFLGAHAIPLEYKSNRQGYIKLLIEEMLPKIAAEGLADYCDTFCEKGFFSVDETDTILQAAAKFGLKPKIHANQLSNSGGVQIGVKNNAISVDHLEEIGEAEIQSLLNSKTLPVALPSCSFFLGIPYSPGRKIIDAGLPFVLATDFNPGSTPSGNIPFVVSLACIRMKLTPEEAINAVTINGAKAMELENEVGTIAVGKRANLIITKPMKNIAYMPYAFGTNHIDEVIIG
ncbi:MAG: imidazolonepropionase [Bacteroidetes bacterium]|nr:imidazolonepropionase [Bacteroidota bacterium]MBK8682649.1 imidazolonepropionase [Bacteroidota bacterium]MBP9705247.1 imidazolonepropionase [Chitinophagales bacterium]